MKPSIAAVLIALLAALALGACGESKEDKAKSTVCDARADISKEVDQLTGLTASTVTVDGVQNSLKAITSNLSKIKDAQGDLSGNRRQQVQDATKTFTSQVQSIAGSVVKSSTSACVRSGDGGSFSAAARPCSTCCRASGYAARRRARSPARCQYVTATSASPPSSRCCATTSGRCSAMSGKCSRIVVAMRRCTRWRVDRSMDS